MSELITFTGGDLGTNGYLLSVENGYLCFDAPEGMSDEIQRRGLLIRALLLTHGHFDHIWDAARIQSQHHCPVYAHPADGGMIRDTSIFRMFGVGIDIPPVTNFHELKVPMKGAADAEWEGQHFRLFHIPGHSLGSVAFYAPDLKLVIGGDVLFAGGVGRWDLPGGSREDLLAGIRTHLLTLPPHVKVYSGHGPATTIGREANTNPYLE